MIYEKIDLEGIYKMRYQAFKQYFSDIIIAISSDVAAIDFSVWVRYIKGLSQQGTNVFRRDICAVLDTAVPR